MRITTYEKGGNSLNPFIKLSKNSPIFIACRPTGIIAILLAFTIAVLLSNNASAANLIQNGDFETGDFINWTKSTPGPSISSTNSHSGSYNSYTYININSGGSGGFDSYVYQSINLTYVDEISFYFLNDVNFVGGSQMQVTVYCDIDRDDSYEWSVGPYPDYDTYQYVEVDVSAISGVHDVEFGFDGGWVSAEFTIINRFDDIVADAILPPSITSYSNSITNDESTIVNSTTARNVIFNITTDQLITTYNWCKNGANQNNNNDEFTTSFSLGPHNLSVNGTNEDGTTNTITWMIASAASPEFDDVSWDHDPYYTGETANITTNILNFDAGTYSYYLDLYNTQEYLTTYEITSETESNYYIFPTEWTDTSLLAKLQRVTDPYGSNEVNLAMDLSHFETLNWDTTISFNQSSYNPSEILKVTWSGAPTGSTVWLRAMDDGEIIKPNVDYSGSFEFTVPSTTQETYYLVDVIVNGVSQAQASCAINIGDYWVADYIYVSNYNFSDDGTYSLHNVDRAEYLNVTTETNINTDFVDVYYNNVYDDRTVSIDHIENLDGTDQVLKFPNDLGSGQYITIIYYHNVTTGTQAELSYYTNVGEQGEGIDIYNAVITMDDTKEILDIESIAGYGGNDLVVPSDRIVIFDIYADEIINSSIITQNYIYDGDANYNSTSDYHIKRSYLFDVLGLIELQFEVHNDATNTDDIIKYNVYVQGIDQTDLDGSVVMYWTKTEIELNDDVLLYFNVSDMPNNPILTIVSTGDSKYTTERTLYTNQTGTESIPDYYKEIGTYTATITCNDIIYAVSTLTIIDLDEEDVAIIPDTTFQDNTNNLLNSPYLIGLLIMAVFLAIGSTSGIGGMIVTGSMGLGIVCYVGIFPWILLVIEVLVVAALMAKGMINLAGD